MGLCGAAAALGFVIGARSTTENRAPLPLSLGSLALYKVNTITLVKEADLFVVRDDTGIGALSASCTHLGCTVRRVAEGFACPCHGALFDEAGIPISGPARRPLPWYAVRADTDGLLRVFPSEEAATAGPVPLALPRSESL